MGYALRNATANECSEDGKSALPVLPVSDCRSDEGGNVTENLEPRVKKLESDVATISKNLATLTVRSESFATHADVANVRTEMTALRGELKEDIASLRGELKADIVSLRGDLTGQIIASRGELREELQKAINRQTVLLLTVIPATLAAIAAVAAWFR